MKLDADSVRKLSDIELADRWGPLKARAKAAEAGIEILKEEFDRRNLRHAIGFKFSVFKTAKPSMRLSVAAIRAEMGAAWCRAREEESIRTTYEVVPAGGAK